MSRKALIYGFSSSLLIFILSGCGSTVTPEVSPLNITPATTIEPQAKTTDAAKDNSVDLSQKSQVFIDGKNDGCLTAKGKYKKDSQKFNHENDYKEGWFYGRSYCQRHK